MPTTEQVKVLTEAYHVLFDLKDASPPPSESDSLDVRVTLRDALRGLSAALAVTGHNAPRRFDGEGRTVDNGGLPGAPFFPGDRVVSTDGWGKATVVNSTAVFDHITVQVKWDDEDRGFPEQVDESRLSRLIQPAADDEIVRFV